MRPRLLPLTLLLCASAASALAPARIAAADDGAMMKRDPVAPIAGTSIWSKVEIEAPARKPKSAALVILGAIIGSLGAAGAVTGSVLLASTSGGCPKNHDENGNVIHQDETRTYTDPATGVTKTVTSTYTLCAGDDPRRNLAFTTLAISAGVAALGLTAVLVGIQPADDEPATARLVPTVAIGPTGGSLTWRF